MFCQKEMFMQTFYPQIILKQAVDPNYHIDV